MWKALAGIAPALTVNLAPSHRDGLVLRSPVLTASGTFGFGDEYRDLVDLSRLGAIVTKTVTPEAREGNPTPRTVETPAGMLNSIGLPNPGVAGVLREKAPIWRELPCPVVVSVSAHDAESWTALAGAFDGLPNVCAIEANLSCPNVSGGLDFSATPEAAAATVAAVRGGTELPVIAKLSPNVGDIRPIARAVEDAGAHAISLINTILGLVVDVERRRAFLGAGSGGVSGPAIRPVALRFVYEARQWWTCRSWASEESPRRKTPCNSCWPGRRRCRWARRPSVSRARRRRSPTAWRHMPEITAWTRCRRSWEPCSRRPRSQ